MLRQTDWGGCSDIRAGASPEPSLPQTVVQLRHLLAIVKQGVILIGGHHILVLVIVHDLIDPPVPLRVDDVGCDGELEKVEHFEAVEEDATEVLALVLRYRCTLVLRYRCTLVLRYRCTLLIPECCTLVLR